MQSVEFDIHNHHKNRLSKQMKEVAERLRNMAEMVEQEAKFLDSMDRVENRSAYHMVRSIQYTINWGVANLPIENMWETVQEITVIQLRKD